MPEVSQSEEFLFKGVVIAIIIASLASIAFLQLAKPEVNYTLLYFNDDCCSLAGNRLSLSFSLENMEHSEQSFLLEIYLNESLVSREEIQLDSGEMRKVEKSFSVNAAGLPYPSKLEVRASGFETYRVTHWFEKE